MHSHRQRNLLMCIVSYSSAQKLFNWLLMAPADIGIVPRGDSSNCFYHDKKIFSVTPFKLKYKNSFLRYNAHLKKRRSKLSI